jgi:hypothetical protein
MASTVLPYCPSSRLPHPPLLDLATGMNDTDTIHATLYTQSGRFSELNHQYSLKGLEGSHNTTHPLISCRHVSWCGDAP